MDCIKIIQLEVFAYHGCEEFEKINGQKFYIDAKPDNRFSGCAKKNRISQFF